jgi:hypothetical protein
MKDERNALSKNPNVLRRSLLQKLELMSQYIVKLDVLFKTNREFRLLEERSINILPSNDSRMSQSNGGGLGDLVSRMSTHINGG